MNTQKLVELGLFQSSSTESSRYIYTTQQTNNIDLLRLLDGKEDFYRLPVPVSELKKKHIIISDPSFALNLISSAYNQRDMLALWSALMNQGFAISVLTDNGLIKIENDFALITALQKIPLIHHDDLIKHIANQGLAKKDCYFAHINEMQGLMSELCYNYYYNEDIIDFDKIMTLPAHVLESFLDSLSDSNPITINLQKNQVIALAENKKLIHYLESRPVLCFKYETYFNDIKIESIRQIIPFFKKWTFPQHTTWSAVSQCLQASPLLEELVFIFKPDELPDNIFASRSLKKLSFNTVDISWNDLVKILEVFPNLEEVRLESCHFNEIPADLHVLLPTVKKIHFNDSNITWSAVSQLLQSCSSLQEIDLINCENLEILPSDLILSSTTIKSFKYEFNNTTWHEAFNFFQSFPAIEAIELIKLKNGEDDDEEDEPTDPVPTEAWPEELRLFSATIKQINLTGNDFSWSVISELVKTCPGLEEITLRACEPNGEWPTELSVISHTLKCLQYDDGTLDLSLLAKILQSCPRIETLRLNYCKLNMSELPDALSTSFSKLKKLKLNVNYTWHKTLQLINLCSSLEELDLSDCKDFEEFPVDLSIYSSKLKKLNLNSTNITWQEVAQLLKLFPSIESIDLSHCNNLGQWSNDISLTSNTLKRMKVDFKNLNWENVSQLLRSCPMLEEINLTFCKELGLLPEDLSFLSNITFLELDVRHVSYADYSRIKKTFPTLIMAAYGLDDSHVQSRLSSGIETETEQELDNSTDVSENTLYTTQVFENIHPREYRYSCYNDIDIRKESVKLKNTPLQPELCELAEPTLGANTYNGLVEIRKNDWCVLPSLSMDDKLIAIRTIPEIEFDIAYNQSEQLYYIKPKHPLITKSVAISYTIESDYIPQKTAPYELKKDIENLIKNFYFFMDGEFFENDEAKAFNELSDDEKINSLAAYFNESQPKTIPDYYKGTSLLNHIIKEQIGACRHRTIAFMALAKNLHLPARAIYNDIHAFVEVNLNGQWQRVDLGGTPANIHILPPPTIMDLPLSKASDKKATSTQLLAQALSPDNPFRTWDTVPISATSMDEYVDKLLEKADTLDPGRKNALSIMDDAQIYAFSTALLNNKKSHCFYLPNLNNVKEKQMSILNADGTLQQQESYLKQFLMNAKPGDVLLVNWSDYQDIHVGYNSIMDTERKIKNMIIPDEIVVIGLLDRNQQMGEDFYSRFRMISDCPTQLTYEDFLPKPGKFIQQADKPVEEICFYDDIWRSALLGQITAANGRYHLSSSPLLNAIDRGDKDLVLRNAPWDLPEFQLFMAELLVKREIAVNGQMVKIPENFNIHRDDTPYLLETENYTVEAYAKHTSLQDAFVLNSLTFNNLFQSIQSDQQRLTTLPGLIAEHKNKLLTLFVTQTLSDLQWARIDAEVKKHNTSLKLVLANGVRLSTHSQIVSHEYLARNAVRLIATNDPDFVSDELSDEAIVIPVNEKMTYADLVGTQFIAKSDNDISCLYISGILTQSLEAGKKIILKGKLSPALAHELSSIYLNYLQTNGERKDNFTGELTIITEQNPGLEFVLPETRIVHENEIWVKLQRVDDKAFLLQAVCEELYKNSNVSAFQYAELLSMLKHLQNHPHSNPLKQILRARADYAQIKTKAENAWHTISSSTSKKIIKDKPVLEKRHNKLEKMLAHSWYVFVAGSSGVGKSTTINQALLALGYKPVTTTGSLKDKLKAWLKPGKKRSLFLDEANLYETGEFDLLEGLYTKPPKLLIDGIYYDVPVDNRLVFAGNFGHFLGRQELRFISRHGNVITFKEFDDAFLSDNIMQPVCNSLKIPEDDAARITKLFLQVYHHVNQANPVKHPLTARNLQMMVMRYAITGNEYLAIQDEMSGVLNRNERKEIAIWINTKFDVDVNALKRSAKASVKVENESQPLLITKKRVNPVRILKNLMQFRDYKINDPTALAGAGSNGLIIEGNPGIGKSYLALEYFRSQGFANGDELSREQAKLQGLDPHQRYYHIQAGDIEEVKATLIKAFHEGACVIIDEMNTMPLEHLLNALLSGTTPEGKQAENPGFFVTGTQNPIHFGKRSAYSPAFLNRFQKLELKDYGKEDLRVITTSLLNGEKEAEKLVDFYLEAREYAKQKHKLSPTPRDLFEKAKNIAKKQS